MEYPHEYIEYLQLYMQCVHLYMNPLTNLHQSPQMRCVDNRRLFTYKHLQLGKIPVQVQPSVSSSMAGKSSMFWEFSYIMYIYICY